MNYLISGLADFFYFQLHVLTLVESHTPGGFTSAEVIHEQIAAGSDGHTANRAIVTSVFEVCVHLDSIAQIHITTDMYSFF